MLSDELFVIGSCANPKSNLSQFEHSHKMLDLLILAEKNGEDKKRLINITKLVCKQLNKAGYPFYKLDVFLKTKS